MMTVLEPERTNAQVHTTVLRLPQIETAQPCQLQGIHSPPSGHRLTDRYLSLSGFSLRGRSLCGRSWGR